MVASGMRTACVAINLMDVRWWMGTVGLLCVIRWNWGFMQLKRRLAIVGAGPSGLTAARQALQYGFSVCVFEKHRDFGGTWRLAVDPEAPRRPVPADSELTCSKQLCAFSELPVPDHFPTFMRPREVLAYLELYVEHFSLLEHIQLGAEVLEVRRTEDWKQTGKWILRWRMMGLGGEEDDFLREQVEVFDAVLLCTGVRLRQWRPPEYRMERDFLGRVLHSEQFTHPADFRGQRVCVVGQGNSALAIASGLAQTAHQVFLCTRRGGWLLSRLRRGGTEPWDWRYQTRWQAVWRNLLPRFLQNALLEAEASAMFEHSPAGLRPEHHMLASHFTFGAEQLGAHIASGRVRVKRSAMTVEFEDGSAEEDIDAVVLCTGFAFDAGLVEQGRVVHMLYNDFHLYKQMYAPELAPHHTLALIGHVQPRGGCLFPIAELQARLFCAVLAGQARLPPPFWMKAELEKRRCAISLHMLKTRRHTQIEDFVPFAAELAHLVGADTPPLRTLLFTDPRLFLALLLGPFAAAQFRLRGPHSAAGEARRQMLCVAERRGLFSSQNWTPGGEWWLLIATGILAVLLIAVLGNTVCS